MSLQLSYQEMADLILTRAHNLRNLAGQLDNDGVAPEVARKTARRFRQLQRTMETVKEEIDKALPGDDTVDGVPEKEAEKPAPK